MTRTVAHEHLRAHLRVVTTSCDCHGISPCPSLDHRARHAEGAIPIGWIPEPDGLATSGQLLESCIACAGVFALVITAAWLGYLGIGWWFEWVIG